MATDNLDLLLRQIEDVEFSARLSSASTFEGFVRSLNIQPEFGSLLAFLQEHDAVSLLFARVTTLAKREIDARYLNPWDSTLAAYLLALTSVSREIGEISARFVRKTPNTLWTQCAAKAILTPATVEASATSPYINVPDAGQLVRHGVDSTESRIEPEPQATGDMAESLASAVGASNRPSASQTKTGATDVFKVAA